MSDWFLLYLLTAVNGLGGVLFFLGVVMLLWPVVAAAAAAGPFDAKEGAGTEAFRANKNKIAWAFLVFVTCALIPSRNDIVFIVGGAKLLEISRGETASRIGAKTLSVVEQYLDDAAKEGEK